MDKQVFDVKFIGLTPVENSGQVSFPGDKEAAVEALSNYLVEVYGPKNYKIIHFEEATEVVEGAFELPINPPTSKVLN